MKHFAGGGAELLGALLAFIFVAAQFGLFVGGISYRKDCPNGDGVKSSWQFTWLAPIPYLFRPSEPGCVVHTGTRVALNAIGVAKFGQPTSTEVAAKAADIAAASGNEDAAYWVRLRGYVEDYFKRNKTVKDLDQGTRSVETLLQQMDDLAAPAKYMDAHRGLVDALTKARDDGLTLRDAARAGDENAYRNAQKALLPDARRVENAMTRLNMLHAGS